jgi:DNA-binding transcriptional LysR family regulator
MKHPLPPLDSLKAFEAAARHLSFSLAADELCISKGAMSYQIRKLEEQVQCALFKRTVRQVYLTDAGQELLRTTKHMFEELNHTLQSLYGESRQTSVSIATSTYVAARWLSPRISEFNEGNPDIAIKLLHSINSTDYKLSDVDMAIEWGACNQKPDRNQLYQIPMDLFPVITPKLMEKFGISMAGRLDIRSILEDPLCTVPLLCEERKLDFWDEWTAASLPGLENKLQNPRRIISDANVRVQAAIDGQGIILADSLLNNEIDNGLLVQPLKDCLQGYGYLLKSSSSRIFSSQANILKNWFLK